MTPFQKKRLSQIAAIENAVQTSISGLTQRQEPDYIAYLTNNLPKELQKVLGAGYNVASAFLHQRPLAKILNPSNTTGKKPDIGDLLLVYIEAMQYNALLLQAKKGSVNTPFPVSRGELHQLELYEKWPKFEYVRANDLNGKCINVSPKIAHPGAQYLVIDDNQSNIVQLGCANASATISVSKCFSEAIYDLIHFQTGRTIAPYKKRRYNNWTTLIWDLILLSQKGLYNRKKINCKDIPRLNDPNHAFLCLLKSCFFDVNEVGNVANIMSHWPRKVRLYSRGRGYYIAPPDYELNPDDVDNDDGGGIGVNVIFIQKKTEEELF